LGAVLRHVFLYPVGIGIHVKELNARVDMVYVDGQFLDFGAVALTQNAKLFMLSD
jgi:hypothetical protein